MTAAAPSHVVDHGLEIACNDKLGATERSAAWKRYEGRRWTMFLATYKHIPESSLTDDERWNIRIFRR